MEPFLYMQKKVIRMSVMSLREFNREYHGEQVSQKWLYHLTSQGKRINFVIDAMHIEAKTEED